MSPAAGRSCSTPRDFSRKCLDKSSRKAFTVALSHQASTKEHIMGERAKSTAHLLRHLTAHLVESSSSILQRGQACRPRCRRARTRCYVRSGHGNVHERRLGTRKQVPRSSDSGSGPDTAMDICSQNVSSGGVSAKRAFHSFGSMLGPYGVSIATRSDRTCGFPSSPLLMSIPCVDTGSCPV